jgi:hypothetical protein
MSLCPYFHLLNLLTNFDNLGTEDLKVVWLIILSVWVHYNLHILCTIFQKRFIKKIIQQGYYYIYSGHPLQKILFKIVSRLKSYNQLGPKSNTIRIIYIHLLKRFPTEKDILPKSNFKDLYWTFYLLNKCLLNYIMYIQKQMRNKADAHKNKMWCSTR